LPLSDTASARRKIHFALASNGFIAAPLGGGRRLRICFHVLLLDNTGGDEIVADGMGAV
jgi:hypothetical protein